MSEQVTRPKEREYQCAACGRTFKALPHDVEIAGGHLCIAADHGLSQHDGLAEIRRGGSSG